jgi:hypothetical protein
MGAPSVTAQPARTKNSATTRSRACAVPRHRGEQYAHAVPNGDVRGASRSSGCRCIRPKDTVTSTKSQASVSHSCPKVRAAGARRSRKTASSETPAAISVRTCSAAESRSPPQQEPAVVVRQAPARRPSEGARGRRGATGTSGISHRTVSATAAWTNRGQPVRPVGCAHLGGSGAAGQVWRGRTASALLRPL